MTYPPLLNPQRGGILYYDPLIFCFNFFSECPNFGAILPVLLKHGIEDLPEHCKLTPGNLSNNMYVLHVQCHSLIKENSMLYLW